MANFFDQFDAPVEKSKNFFDQFDAPDLKKAPSGPQMLSDEDTSSDFLRGLGNLPGQLQETYGAAKALVGRAVGSRDLMESGVETMKTGEAKQVSKESDDVTKAWEKGIGSVVFDWLPYQMGAGVGSLLETLGFMGAGAVGGMGVGSIPGAVSGAIGKTLIKKGIKEQVEQLVAQGAKDKAEDLIKKEAKIALTEMGKAAGMGAQATMHGAGEVTSRAVNELEKEGKDIKDLDMGRVAPAAIAHGVADWFSQKITLGAIKPISDAASKSLVLDVAKAIAKTGTKEILPEEIQTIAERYGASLSLTDAEALKEYINTAAASYAMSVVPGGIGGARTHFASQTDKQAQDKQDEIKSKEGFSGDETTKTDPAANIDPDLEAKLQPAIEATDTPTPIVNSATQTAITTENLTDDQKKLADLQQDYDKRQAKIDAGTHPNMKAARDKNEIRLKEIEALQKTIADKGAPNATQQAITQAVGGGAPVPGGPVTPGAAAMPTGDGRPGVVSPQNIIAPTQAGAVEQPSPVTPRTVDAVWKTPDGNEMPVKLDTTVDAQIIDGVPKLKAYDQDGQTIFIPQMQAWKKSASAVTPTLAPTQAGAVEQPSPVTKPNPLAPNDPNSWQDSFGYIHYKMDVPFAGGKGRVTELIDQEQSQNIALKFTDSKGNPNRTLSVGFDNAGKPYWFMGEASEDTIKKAIGEPLYNALGDTPITNTDEYQALVQRVKAALKQPITTTAAPAVPSTPATKPTPAPKRVSAKQAEKITATNYLEQPSYYGDTAPGDVDTGVKYAGREQGYDFYDTVDHTAVGKQLKQIAAQKNKEQKQKREDKRASMTKAGYSPAEIKQELANIKDYDASSPLDFMTKDELVALYRENAGKKGFTAGEKATREAYAKNRENFIGTLTPQQKLGVDYAAEKAFEQEVLATETRAKETTTSDKRKQRDVRRRERTVEDVQKQITEAQKTEEELIAEDQAAEQKAIEAREKSAKKELSEAQKKDLEEKKKAQTGRHKVSVATEKAINETDNVAEVLVDIADPDVNEWNTRKFARFFLSMLKENKLIESLSSRIVFGQVLDGDGQYDPATNTITIKGENGKYTGKRRLDQVVVHEVTHSLIDHVVDNRAAYLASIFDPAKRKNAEMALNRLDNTYRFVRGQLGNKYNIGTMKEFLAEFASNSRFQLDLIELKSPTKEFKAREGREGIFTSILRNILKALGIDMPTDSPTFKEILEDFSEIISLPTAEIRGKEVSFAKQLAEEPALREEDLYGKGTGKATEYGVPNEQQPKNYKFFKELFTTTPGWRTIARKFQNDRYEVKHWQDVLDLAGKIYRDGKDKLNNIYEQITLSTGRAKNFYNFYVKDISEHLDKQISEFAKAAKLTTDETLSLLHRLLETLHENERRQVKYVLTVPLNNQPVLQNAAGKRFSPADRRKEIVSLLNTKVLSESQAQQLRNELDTLVDKYKDENGYSDRKPDGKPMSIDIENSIYNVLGVSREALAKRREQYQNDPHKEQLDKILASLKQLNEVTAKLDKESNYWSDFVTNRKYFYGWDYYAPFKGKSSFDKHSAVDEMLDFDSEKMGKEMQDVAHSLDGRLSVSDNPVLQTMSDATRAAMRAGRRELTQSIKNAVAKNDLNPDGQGLIPSGRVIKRISFEDRQDENILKEIPREKTIFHYNDDGSIDIIQIDDKKILSAIRRTYENTNPFVDMANRITSGLGKLHTRYNYNFAPLNFVRDALTNAWAIGAEMGPAQALRYAGQIASLVSQGGLPKAFKVVALYERGDKAQLNRLAKDDPFIKDMVEYIQEGGLVSYIQGLSLKSNFQELHKEIGKSGILKTPQQLGKFLDIWTEMFEVASRSAAYSIAKKNAIAQKLTEKEAQIKAAAYAKNLANFEQVGEWGKAMGAFYMFFRPSATGAVRAIEALAPAFRSMDAVVRGLPAAIRENPEALAKFKENYAFKQKSARIMASSLIGLGMVTYIMASMMAPDDDLGRNEVMNDNMDQWTRFARFHMPKEFGKDVVVQIPWGFGLGSFASAGAQLMSVLYGKQSMKDALANVFLQISLDSFVPIPVSRMKPADNQLAFAIDSIMPSAVRPAVEFVMNKNGLGQDIYNDSNRRMGDAYLGGDKIPEIYKTVARYFAESDIPFLGMGGVDISPNTLYFLSNSYADGISKIGELSYGVSDLSQGRKEFNAKTDLPLFGSFFGAKSSVDTREFSEIEKQIQEKERRIKMFESNPIQAARYEANHPMDQLIVDTYNLRINGDLKRLQSEAKQVRLMSDVSPKDREAMLKINKIEQNLLKHEMIQEFKAYGVTP